MGRILSNGGSGDFVIQALQKALARSENAFLAAPYFDYPDPVIDAASRGVQISLLIGLNSATQPTALEKIATNPSISVRYFTDRFHAKVYVFDEGAIVGSANLTNAGMRINREAVILLDRDDDRETIDEVRSLFMSLWDDAHVLTDEKRAEFHSAWSGAASDLPNADRLIERIVGRVVPTNVDVASRGKSSHRLFIESIRRQVYEQYRPAFIAVQRQLVDGGLRRAELSDLGAEHETNRFLNWVRLAKAPGEEAWRAAPIRSADERGHLIDQLGREWMQTSDHRVPPDYLDRLNHVIAVFGTANSLAAADKESITASLLGLHAFSEQQRFVKGGLRALPTAFWASNEQNEARVRRTLTYLVHGPDDFAIRLHDVLYDGTWKLAMFKVFCALELFGSIFPGRMPPMNGRMAKALRWLGFDVQGP